MGEPEDLAQPAVPPTARTQNDQLYDTGNPVAPDSAVGRGSRHQRGRSGISGGQRADGRGITSNQQHSRPQRGREGNGEEQAEDGANSRQISQGGSSGRASRILPPRIPAADIADKGKDYMNMKNAGKTTRKGTSVQKTIRSGGKGDKGKD